MDLHISGSHKYISQLTERGYATCGIAAYRNFSWRLSKCSISRSQEIVQYFSRVFSHLSTIDLSIQISC